MHSIDCRNTDLNVGKATQGVVDRKCGCEYDEARGVGRVVSLVARKVRLEVECNRCLDVAGGCFFDFECTFCHTDARQIALSHRRAVLYYL